MYKQTPYIPYLKLADQLPLKKGDIVLVGSDILKILIAAKQNGEKFDPKLFIDSILDKITAEGTVLFPSYSWEFCQTQIFDIRSTPANTGALANAALKHPDFKRTQHPMFSFAVWGKHADTLCAMDNIDGWSKDSPFEFLVSNNAKYLFIGIHYSKGLTLDHYCEEACNVEYRYFKEFNGTYIDNNGEQSQRRYTMFVRNLETTLGTGISELTDKVFADAGCYHTFELNGIDFSTLEMKTAADIMINDISSKRELIYIKLKEPA